MISTYSLRLLFLVHILIAVVCFCIILGGKSNSGSETVLIGVLCSTITLLPIVVREKVDLFEPIVLFYVTVLLSCFARSIYVVFQDQSHYKVAWLLNGNELSELLSYLIFVPLGLLSFVSGYMLCKQRLPLERTRLFSHRPWPKFRLYVVVLGLLGLATLSIILLVKQNGIDLNQVDSLSVKRSIELDDYGRKASASAGYLRWMSSLAFVAFLIVLAARLDDRKKGRRGASKLLVGLAFILSVAWPVLSSSRTGMFEVVFSSFVLWYYMREKVDALKLKVALLSIVLVGASVLVGVGIWRQYSQFGELKTTSVGTNIADQVLANGNFLDPIRTALIIRSYGSQGGYELGGSYFRWAVAPIPRRLWDGKPEIGLGPEVKRNVFGHVATANGYPPGLIGEAFINFSYVGILVMPFIIGYCLNLWYRSFQPLLGRDRKATIIYSISIWVVSVQLAELDISMLIVKLLMLTMPLFIIFSLLDGKRVELSS